MRNPDKLKSTLVFGSALTLLLMLPGPALADANIEMIAGNVQYDAGGKGYKPIKTVTRGKTGDTVMAEQKGSAVVVYDDGCRVRVRPGQVVTVLDMSPCKTGIAEDPDNLGYLVAGAAAAGTVYLIIKDAHQPASP